MTIEETFSKLSEIQDKHVPILISPSDQPGQKEWKGTKEVMQGRKKVDGIFFGSIVKKPNDVRFYFFPIYTHPDSFSLSIKLKKMQKGKSCFHLKSMDNELMKELEGMIDNGVDLYRESDWV
jgi:hypothetical protein